MYFLNIANVHTVSVDFLRILEYMGVEARIGQYKAKVRTFCMPIPEGVRGILQY